MVSSGLHLQYPLSFPQVGVLRTRFFCLMFFQAPLTFILICNVFSFHIEQQCVDTLNYCVSIRKRVGVTLSLTLHLSMQVAAVTTCSGWVSEFIWKERIYSSFERTDGV